MSWTGTHTVATPCTISPPPVAFVVRTGYPKGRAGGTATRRGGARGILGEAMAGDEFLLDTPRVRAFIEGVRAAIAGSDSPAGACAAIRPGFAELLGDSRWLPERFMRENPDSGMGGGIGQWLLFRAGDRSLTLFALVVPAGSATPIHDHLA